MTARGLLSDLKHDTLSDWPSDRVRGWLSDPGSRAETIGLLILWPLQVPRRIPRKTIGDELVQKHEQHERASGLPRQAQPHASATWPSKAQDASAALRGLSARSIEDGRRNRSLSLVKHVRTLHSHHRWWKPTATMMTTMA